MCLIRTKWGIGNAWCSFKIRITNTAMTIPIISMSLDRTTAADISDTRSGNSFR